MSSRSPGANVRSPIVNAADAAAIASQPLRACIRGGERIEGGGVCPVDRLTARAASVIALSESPGCAAGCVLNVHEKRIRQTRQSGRSVNASSNCRPASLTWPERINASARLKCASGNDGRS